jgi:hypothetical protein
MQATFYAYQGTNRDNLIDRLVSCPDWSHVSQVTADTRLNSVRCTVYFRKRTARARKACIAAQILSGWTLHALP